MKNLISVLSIMVLLVLVGCATTDTKDIEIQSMVDAKANFVAYKTYRWSVSAGVLNDPQGQWANPGFDAVAEIKYIIDGRLRDRGMTEVTTTPDVLVGFAMGVDMANIEYTVSADESFKALEAVPKGGLVILLIDADTGVVIWAGAATAEIKGKTGADAKQRLQYAVNRIMDTLPR